MKVNAGAIPDELIESELFGAEPGAFTGATRLRIGRFEAANGGTLFLDEIGNLSLAGQTKLLRVLQSGEFERLGSSETRQRRRAHRLRDERATCAQAIARGHVPRRTSTSGSTSSSSRVPPLRERREDVLPLAERSSRRRGSEPHRRATPSAARRSLALRLAGQRARAAEPHHARDRHHAVDDSSPPKTSASAPSARRAGKCRWSARRSRSRC